MAAAVCKAFEGIVAEDMHLKRLRKMHRRAADWTSKLRQCVRINKRGGQPVGEGDHEDMDRRVEGEAEGLAGAVSRLGEFWEKFAQQHAEGRAGKSRKAGEAKGGGKQGVSRETKRKSEPIESQEDDNCIRELTADMS